jgi:hypothetical protein
MLVVIIHPEQWNGGSDRCTVSFHFHKPISHFASFHTQIGMIRHFVAGGHRVVWLTTWIDEYWANEDFHGVEIIQFGLDLHPGDWFTQNVALGYRLIASGLQPDLVVVDHSARSVTELRTLIPNFRLFRLEKARFF